MVVYLSLGKRLGCTEAKGGHAESSIDLPWNRPVARQVTHTIMMQTAYTAEYTLVMSLQVSVP